jgi:hypothetical protein
MFNDLTSSCSDETIELGLPFFTPPPLEEVLRGFDSLDVPVDAQIPPLIDGSFPTYRDASTLSLAASSESTDSTGLTEDISNSEYSSMSFTSNYPSLFDLDLRDIVFGSSEDNYVDPKHTSAISDPSMHGHVVKAHGPDGQLAGVSESPHCLSPASPGPSPPPAVPFDPPTDAASATRVFTGPIRKKPSYYQCDQCGRGKYNLYFIYFRDTQCFFLVIKRKSNMTAHKKTHDPNRERFVCPEPNCGYPFTRPHDRQRHLDNINIHGVLEE